MSTPKRIEFYWDVGSTQEGLVRGVFGAPSFIIDEELYWGKDRMDFIEDALSRS